MDALLLNLLEKIQVRAVISTLESPNEGIPFSFDYHQVLDVRSAAFEAFGMAKMSHDLVALLIDERYLANAYTALIEVWFQKINLLVVTVNGDLYQSLEYLDRCIVSKHMLFSYAEIESIKSQVICDTGPHLVRTNVQLTEDKRYDYTSIINDLDKIMDKDDFICCYSPMKTLEASKLSILPVDTKHKYCVVSKYVGSLLGSEHRRILIIPEILLSYDSNIFNFRDLPSNFFVIILPDGSNKITMVSGWIESNSIHIVRDDAPDYASLIRESEKTLVYLKKN